MKTAFWVASAALFVGSAPAFQAQCEFDSFFVGDGTKLDLFGHEVAVDGTHAIIGAAAFDTDALLLPTYAPMSVHAFERRTTGWVSMQELAAPDTVPEDVFGYSVAISGRLAVVGAPFQDELVGAAYVFALGRGGWSQVAKLLPPEATPQRFGTCVAIDGTKILVGAPIHLGAGPGSGAAYLFEFAAPGWSLEQAFFPEASWQTFGTSCDLDGSRLVVSSRGPISQQANAPGRISVFEEGDARWLPAGNIDTPPLAFGTPFTNIDLEGDNLIAATGGNSDVARVYEYDGASWNATPLLADGLASTEARSVAIRGNYAAVGVRYINQRFVFLYTRRPAGWVSLGPLDSGPEGQFFVDYGEAVAFGDRELLVGAPKRSSSTVLTFLSSLVHVWSLGAACD